VAGAASLSFRASERECLLERLDRHFLVGCERGRPLLERQCFPARHPLMWAGCRYAMIAQRPSLRLQLGTVLRCRG